MKRIAAVLLLLAGSFGPAIAEAGDASGATAHDFSFEMPHGDALSLRDFQGKAVLIVNTATECGFSGQLSGLQQLHETYADRGLVVLGVPSNDFGGQEPRADGDIAKFCEAKYGAAFPLTAKTSVKGKDAHPFYQWVADTMGVAARPYWNFHKYLIGPDGRIVAWFSTPTSPTSRKVTAEIEQILDALPGS